MRRGHPVRYSEVNILQVDDTELSTQIWWLILWGWIVKGKLKGKRTNFSVKSWNMTTLGNRRMRKSQKGWPKKQEDNKRENVLLVAKNRGVGRRKTLVNRMPSYLAITETKTDRRQIGLEFVGRWWPWRRLLQWRSVSRNVGIIFCD